MIEFLLILLVLAATVLVITRPFRAGRGEDGDVEDPVVAELEAEKEAKYREIRDTEMDHRTGKLSDEDFRAVDAGLRSEAVAILDRLDAAQAAAGRRAGDAHDDAAPGGASR